MNFIVHTDSSGKKTLYPNKSNTPKDILKEGVEEFEVPTDKQGLMELMQDLLDRIPTGEPETSQEAPSRQPEPVERDEALTTREQFDAAWEDFPMALKFHYGALAFEDARHRLKE